MGNNPPLKAYRQSLHFFRLVERSVCIACVCVCVHVCLLLQISLKTNKNPDFLLNFPVGESHGFHSNRCVVPTAALSQLREHWMVQQQVTPIALVGTDTLLWCSWLNQRRALEPSSTIIFTSSSLSTAQTESCNLLFSASNGSKTHLWMKTKYLWWASACHFNRQHLKVINYTLNFGDDAFLPWSLHTPFILVL